MSPDGKKSFTYGGWRLADWALNLDAGYVLVDADANRTSARFPIVTGYRGFPRGLVARRSGSRSTRIWGRKFRCRITRVPSTDDIYLRLADDPQALKSG